MTFLFTVYEILYHSYIQIPIFIWTLKVKVYIVLLDEVSIG